MRDSRNVNKSNQLPRRLTSSTREFQLLQVSSAASFLCENWSLAYFPQNLVTLASFPQYQLPRQWCFPRKLCCFAWSKKNCTQNETTQFSRETSLSRELILGKRCGSGQNLGKYARLQFSQRKLAADNTGSNWNSRVLDTRSLWSWLDLLTFPEVSHLFPRINSRGIPRELILGKRCERSGVDNFY
jgi:hypothetical protein